MFWLVFYNGFEKPECEAAFSVDFLVAEYARRFITSAPDRTECYSVFLPDKSTVVSLKSFLKKMED